MSENQDKNTSSEDEPSPQVSAHAVDQIFDEQNQSAASADPSGRQNQTGNPVEDNDVEALKQQLAEKEDQLLRSIAEADNIRKRARREVEEARKYAPTGLLLDLLTVVDDLRRAIDSAEQNEEGRGLLDGVKMVASRLESVLENHHCKKIEAVGKPFDPNLHEAIQMQPSENVAANHVSLEARSGYQFHDRVLRTAQVFVSTGKPDSGT